MAEGGSSVNYPKNAGWVTDSTGLVIGQNSTISYIIRNDGTTPASIFRFGYAQVENPSLLTPSTLSNQVIIRPGLGSVRGPEETVFNFNTISNELTGLHAFNAGDGVFPESRKILVPNGVSGVKIHLDPRNEEGPPAWFIEVDSSWYSTSTVIGTERFRLTFELLGEINAVVTTGKAIESGATIYRYSRTKTRPVVSKDHPLFPPSKPL